VRECGCIGDDGVVIRFIAERGGNRPCPAGDCSDEKEECQRVYEPRVFELLLAHVLRRLLLSKDTVWNQFAGWL